MPIETRWYVVHTYSGYENKVADSIVKMAENRKMQDLILEVKIPTETVTDAEKKKEIERKLFPGYVLVKVAVTPDKDNRPKMSDETWLLIRNTRGVTGFVGPGSKPVPLTDEEVTKLGVEYIPIELDLSVGESVRVVSGPLENFIGTVEALDPERQKVKLTVSIFNRDTPVELDYIQVQKL